MKDSSSPVIPLLGQEEENFYQLGIQDQKGFLLSYQSLQKTLGHFPPYISELFHGLLKQGCLSIIERHPQLKRNLEAYAEGLEVPPRDVYGAFFLPEILSASGRFIPNLMGTLLGCSSLFFRESQDSGISHFRLLDFPIYNTFTTHAKTVLFQFPRQKVFYFTLEGLPYPALTAMNESGITLALHQKSSTFFDYKGTPIFEVAKLIMAEARDKQDIESIIKDNPTMTGWGLYSCVGDEVLAIDLLGNQSWIKSYPLEVNKTHYFCNESPDHKAYNDTISLGLNYYNQMRRESIEEYLGKKSQKNPLRMESILKGLSQPLGRKGTSAARWKSSPLSLCTIDSCVLNPQKQWALRLKGKAPKIFEQGHETYHKCFTNPVVKSHQKRSIKRFHSYYQGFRHLSQCTECFQKKNIHGLFHSLQMSIVHFQGWPEQTIASFYNNVFQYIFLKEPARDETVMLKAFEQLLGKLPPFLNEHCKLFILRLSKLLGLPTPKLTLDHDGLGEIWKKEAKLLPSILRIQRFLYIPRPETSDIAYPFYQ